MLTTSVTFPHNWRELPVWSLLLIDRDSRNWRKTFVQAEVYRDSAGMSDLVYVFLMKGYWIIDRVNPEYRNPTVYFVMHS